MTKKKESKKKSKKPSFFSSFTNKVSGTLKDLVEVPEEEQKAAEAIEETKTQEELEPVESYSESLLPPIEDNVEIEQPEFSSHDEVLQNLQSAASEWKESGETGFQFEQPEDHHSIKDQVSDFIAKASEKFSQKKKAKKKEDPQVKEDLEFIEKLGETEKDEIEKIYKQLKDK